MKKIIFASLFLLFLGINSQAQNNIIVQQSNPAASGTTTDSNTYYINGISSKEDVGGVEYTFRYVSDSEKTVLDLTNYHNCTVTVLIDFCWYCSSERYYQIMGDGVKSIVLRANEMKSFDVGMPNCGKCVDILGMIVRKLQ